MVSQLRGASSALVCQLLAQDKPQTPLSRLDPQTRAKVLAALAGLIILGFGMVALAWLGARVTRRYMNQTPPRKERTPGEDDWAQKPLHPIDRPGSGESESEK
jgi:hypothetical protein